MERVRETLGLLRPGAGTLVRVVEIRGIGVRDSTDGAVVVPTPSGSSVVKGSVLGGIADQFILDAGDERQVIEAPVAEGDAVAAGLLCGGRATLLLSPVTDLPEGAADWFASADPVVLIAAADGSGTDLAVGPSGVSGTLWSPSATEAAIGHARQLLRRGRSDADVAEIEGQSVLFSAAVPTTRAIIIGDGPMAEAFRAQGELMGWEVGFVDDMATAVSFCAAATGADALLVLSHDPDVDVPVLAAGLDGNVGYIGAMGSRHTQARRGDQLEALGYTDRSRIHGPVGLDLGSRSPAETAVAMAAEFLAVRRGRPPASLSAHDGPIHT
ncbi:MAG: XdhC family protein [Acidimicrobiia bacterium]|nr:XdhC family protein [Acidimicrobiia bacterium]